MVINSQYYTEDSLRPRRLPLFYKTKLPFTLVSVSNFLIETIKSKVNFTPNPNIKDLSTLKKSY